VDGCRECAKWASRPRRFKLSLGAEDLRFNAVVMVDIMYLERVPMLHIVDQATHFTSARFLENISSENIWKVLRQCWNEVYLGPPDVIKIDSESHQFASREFSGACAAYEIEVDKVGIESPSSMGLIERYHAPLRAAC
jgi:hypothetical protein